MKRGKREVKRAYGLGRRFLAMFLAMVMCTSMLQLTAFATTYEDQVMENSQNPDYYTVDANGVNRTDAKFVEDGVFTLKKEIKQTGKDAFDITLTVETSETVTTSHSKAATVLVIDLSNSMKDPFGNSTRMAEAKKVAKEFLASYAGTDPNAEQYISVVWFGTNSGVDKDWVNVAGGEGHNSYDAIASYLDTWKAPHPTGEPNSSNLRGGTNLDAGLTKANEQLAKRASISEQKNVVLITDGKPTFYLDNNGNRGGDGQVCDATVTGEAAAAAALVKESATLYTVCLAAEDQECYTGASITVCKHCEQTQDKHTKVTSCDNCGKTKEQHNTVKYGSRTYYVCPDASWPYGYNEYYDEETTLYCANGKNTYSAKTVSGGKVTVGYFLSNDIATSASTAFNASTTDALKAALAAIAGSIESNGYTGEGTFVTDPMGDFINFTKLGEVKGGTATVEDNTLTWNLDPKTANQKPSGDTTTYTYTLKYSITLDTAAEGFKETENGNTKYYPTNGRTFLSVPQTDGSTKEIEFLVPGVCGEIPEVNWTVEYYLQENATKGDYAHYTKVETYDKGKPVELWNKVFTPDGYVGKYDAQNYQHVAGTSELTLTSLNAADNVMRHYYDRIEADVTVQHWYKLNIITREGVVINGDYTADTMTSETESEYVGERYSADRVYKYGDFVYTEDLTVNGTNCPEGGNQRINDATIESVSRNSEDNVINLYYTFTWDQRQPTSAKVLHTYITNGYDLKDGKYVEKEIGRNTVTVQDESDLIATTSYDVISTPQTGYESYVLTEAGDYNSLTNDGNGNLSFVLAEDPSQNIRELVFEDTVDERTPVTVTVKHYYTKVVTEVLEDGTVYGPETVLDEFLGKTEVFNDYYEGEDFTPAEFIRYEGEDYVRASSNAAALETRQLTSNNNVIELYYNLTVEPETTKVIVNHHYRTTTTTITENIDADGNVISYTEAKNTTTDTQSVESDELYVNQTFVAAIVGRDNFSFNADESDEREVTATADPIVINLYYDRGETNDLRRAAEIDVQHNYYVNLETIVDGQVGYRKVSEGSETESFPQEDAELKAGEVFTAIPDTKDARYTVDTTTSDPLTVVLQPGTNSTITINYIRNDSNLKRADYTVDYVYNTYNMYVDNGVAKYPDLTNPTSFTNGDQVKGSGYVGQSITLDPKVMDGYVAAEGNPGAEQTLGEKNEWTFVYNKFVPLAKGTVRVNHHYTTKTIAIDGTSTTKTETTSTSVEKFVGERYVANANTKGDTFKLVNSAVRTEVVAAAAEDVQASYTITVIDGITVVDFYYEKTIDNSKTAKYEIYHEYYLYNYDGSLLKENKPAPETGTGFVTTSVKAMPDPNAGYELYSATYNGDPLAADYTFELIDGANKVVFVYKKTLPQDKVDVKVIHNYYKNESFVGGEFESKYEETIKVFEDTEYTAEERDLESSAYTYVFHSANPESKTIMVDDNPQAENVIIMNYVRATAEYQVIHVYNRNGAEEGRTTTTLAGRDGELIEAAKIVPVTVYEGKTYTFLSVTGDITLKSTLDADQQTITLTYNRTIDDEIGGGDGGGTVIIPENPIPLDPAPQPAPEVVIPEEDVPQVDIPEEDVPMADVPKTNDASALWLMMSVLSGSGLAGMAFLGRKKREEEI